MSLPHYSPSEMKLLVKHLEPSIIDSFSKLDGDKKRYVGSIILSEQLGGNTDIFGEIRRGLDNIKLIAKNLIIDIRNHFNKLQLTEKQNEELVEEVRQLKERIKDLEANCSQNSQRLEEECNKKLTKYDQYLDRFLQVQTSLARLVAKIEELAKSDNEADKNSLKVLNQYGDFSQQGYERLWKKIQEEKNSIETNATCENVDTALGIIERYANPQLYQRILDDFEDLSGTVRVYVRILNRSIHDDSMKIKNQTFNHYVGLKNANDTKLTKVRSQHTYNCNDALCPTPPSVIKSNKIIKRTQYPCNDTDTMINFRPIYGPFFSVFENDTNMDVYRGIHKEPGIQNIIQQVLTGTDVVLFGYGLSGSGKTYTLLGSPTENGMVQFAIDELLKKGSTINMQVEELYGRLNPRQDYNNVDEQYLRYDPVAITSSTVIADEITKINLQRESAGRIKFTPNNPQSSRSHLFLKFNIQYRENRSILTFIDMAGVEDPYIIANTFLPIHPTNLKRLNRETIKSLILDISNPKANVGDSEKFYKTIWPKSFIEQVMKLKLEGKQDPNAKQTPEGYIFGSGCTPKITMQEVIQNPAMNTTRNPNDDKIELEFRNHCDSTDQLMKQVFLLHFKQNVFKSDELYKKLFTNPETKKLSINMIVDYIWNMLQEGYYINETLNHLRIFLLKRMKKDIKVVDVTNFNNTRRNSITSASKASVFATLSPRQFKVGADDANYTNDKLFYNPLPLISDTSSQQSSSIKMIPLLKSLFRDNSEKRPKFIMMVNVRTDLNDTACAGTSATLDFADSVKST